jgi:hypothetical protein
MTSTTTYPSVEAAETKIEALRVDLLLLRIVASGGQVWLQGNVGNALTSAHDGGFISIVPYSKAFPAPHVVLTERGQSRVVNLTSVEDAPAETAVVPPGSEIQFPDLSSILSRHGEKLDQAIGMLKAMMPRSTSWNETSG